MDETRRLRQTILEAMRREDWEPAAIPAIRTRLRIPKSQKGAFTRAFKELLAEEAVVRVDRKRYAAADRARTGQGKRGPEAPRHGREAPRDERQERLRVRADGGEIPRGLESAPPARVGP
ncbi:MAG TPA: hypothetical protein VFB95_12945, partial [Candidatus Cryosericum sp.]|nr:hypothetical protein [Candidatus Cryosericum sp.]